MEWIGHEHRLLLSSYVLEELREVISRKAPGMKEALEDFITRLPFELCQTPLPLPEELLFEIRDPDDAAVLYSAMLAQADVLITGDKDFSDVNVPTPEILTPAGFVSKYIRQVHESLSTHSFDATLLQML